MTKDIKKVGVIGAGTMGAGIAGQLANAGVEVVLLDLMNNDTGRNRADEAIERMQKAKPTDAFNAGLMLPENAKHIKTGLSTDNLDMLADCDWIIETILAPQEIRAGIYKNLEKIAKPDAIFSSNTSTMQIESLTGEQSDEFKSRFVNAHFFNPVRFMHLLEVISNDDTKPEVVDAVMKFGSETLGKKTVHCKDERGFIANRIGIFAMERARVQAVEMDMDIEDVDSIMGMAFGFPKLGLFKLADEVGLPVIEHVRTDLHSNLPDSDEFQKIFSGTEELETMLDNGYLGNRDPNSKGGYYRKKKDAQGNLIKDKKGKPLKETRDLESGEYRDFKESPFFKFEKTSKRLGYKKFFDFANASLTKKFMNVAFDNYNVFARNTNNIIHSILPLRPLPERKGPSNAQISQASSFAWPVIRDIMTYTLDHAQELAYDLQDIDDAMRAGFNWEYGPFELMDKFGVEWFASKLENENHDVPALLQTARKEGSFYRKAEGQNQVMNFDGSYNAIKRSEGVLSLDDVKASSQPLVTHHSASLWDLGDGVTALEFHSTKNAIDPSIFRVINESIKFMEEHADQYKGMVVYNDDKSFSFGANLKLVEPFMNACKNPVLKTLGIGGYIEKNLYNVIEELVYQGQAVYNALNQAPFPVVGAPKGTPQNMAFGGAAEILMHCDAIQAGPEQIVALPESGLGLVPAWGGTTRYLQNATEKPGQKGGPMPPVIEATLALANPMGSAATCSQDAKKKLWFGQDDGISMNPDRVLADAKAKVLKMAPEYAPKQQPTFSLPGLSGKGAIRMQVDQMYKIGGDPSKAGINHIDVKVADALADILVGGETIKRSDIDEHVSDYAVANKLKQIMDERGEDEIAVHPGIEMNISRMLQLERDRFIDRFRDLATQKRVSHMLSKGAPLRENRPDPQPTPHEIRATIEKRDLNRREVDGKPLTGNNGDRLKAMADMTTEFYKLNDARTAMSKVKQAPKLLASLKHTLDMF